MLVPEYISLFNSQLFITEIIIIRIAIILFLLIQLKVIHAFLTNSICYVVSQGLTQWLD